MLTPTRSSQFKKDVKKAGKAGRDMDALKAVLKLLVEQAKLPARYRDHALSGKLKAYRELHITPDWLLMYRVVGETLELVRTGSHSELF